MVFSVQFCSKLKHTPQVKTQNLQICTVKIRKILGWKYLLQAFQLVSDPEYW